MTAHSGKSFRFFPENSEIRKPEWAALYVTVMIKNTSVNTLFSRFPLELSDSLFKKSTGERASRDVTHDQS